MTTGRVGGKFKRRGCGATRKRARGGGAVTRSRAKAHKAAGAVRGSVRAFMEGPADVAGVVLSNLDFVGLRRLHQQVLQVEVANAADRGAAARGAAREAAEEKWRARMAEVTAARPFVVRGTDQRLTPDQLQWLSSSGVRTVLKPVWRKAVWRKAVFKGVDLGPSESMDCWVNGAAVLRVNACGEFWLSALAKNQFELNYGWAFQAHMYPDGVGGDVPSYPSAYLHRVGAPAVRDSDGFELWARHGVLHRLDGPAVVPGAARRDGDDDVDGDVDDVMEPAWYFRGTRMLGGQAQVEEAAAQAPPDPIFDDGADPDALPKGIEFDPEWSAILADKSPRPLPRQAPLPELPFSPNPALEQLLRSDDPMGFVHARFATYLGNMAEVWATVAPPAQTKPLGDLMRQELLAKLSAALTAAETFRMIDNDDSFHWNTFVLLGLTTSRCADVLRTDPEIDHAGIETNNAGIQGLLLDIFPDDEDDEDDEDDDEDDNNNPFIV